MKGTTIAELIQHANNELKHVGLLADRILQLGKIPILTPNEWNKMTNCGYAAPIGPKVGAILKQNIKGEQCAIEVYIKIMKATQENDYITYQLAFEILRDEVEHEKDLQALEEDLELMK